MSSTAAGNALEEEIFQLFRSEIEGGRFWAKKANCKLFRRKGYFSKDRNANIVFDVSIEIFLPRATEFSFLVLIECKNYSHSVPVDDAEEFFAKVQQVAPANGKAILASTAAFQSGAREFSKSKGMGLLRYFGAGHKWELKRSPSAGARSTSVEAQRQVGVGLSQPDFRSDIFDLFLQSPNRDTNSLWDFFEDLISGGSLPDADVRKVSNSRNHQANLVPFYEHGQLEAVAEMALDAIEYSSGAVSLDAICEYEAARVGLLVERIARQPSTDGPRSALGRIEFEPLRIQVFTSDQANVGRQRFTLAHELGHHLLGHGKFMTREYCDEEDFVLHRRRIDDGTDVARLEYQANYFAANLLMPRTSFVVDFWRAPNSLALRNKGFGPLYVDDQPCNIQSYRAILGALTDKYQVSHLAAAIRLEGLGLLRDARVQRLGSRRNGFTSVLDAAISAIESESFPDDVM